MGELSGVGRQLSVAGNAVRALLSSPQLFVYPVLAIILILGLLLVCVGGAFAVAPSLVYVGVLAYVVVTPIVFAVLMVGYCYELNEVFLGRNPGIGSGLRRAMSRIKMTVIAGVVIGLGGMAAKVFGNSVPFGDRLGVASSWGLQVAGVFAFPAVATTDGTLRDTVDDVTTAVEKEWGKSLVATVGTRALGLVIFWTGMIAAIALAVLAFLGSFAVELPPLGAFTLPVVLPVVALVTAFIVQFTVDGVVKTALFRYTMDGELPPVLSGKADAFLKDESTSGGRRAPATTDD